MTAMSELQPIQWDGQQLTLLDQRALPHTVNYVQASSHAQVIQCISQMVVRGAPAIGITAAYGMVLAAQACLAEDIPDWQVKLQYASQQLAESRPTAVNLHWALLRMQRLFMQQAELDIAPLIAEAQQIHQDDIAINQRMAQLGADLIVSPCEVITHCNTGSFATGGWGTAIGVIRSAHQQGKIHCVHVGETRPWLQGARLTSWELQQANIPVSLNVDSAAAFLMQRRPVGWVIVGADRVTANGDVANKIGTYPLAIAARYHGVKVMVVAPTSTLDLNTSSGEGITIEERDADEVRFLQQQPIAPDAVAVRNPAFDVTPADLVDALVTEQGVVLQPNKQKIAALVEPG